MDSYPGAGSKQSGTALSARRPRVPHDAPAHVFQDAWEEGLTVVHWDQRGAGKTAFAANPAAVLDTFTFERMVSDAHELVLYLLKRLGRKKIFLLGHSWGSMLGITLAHRHPELFHADIGIGQCIDNYNAGRIGTGAALAAARKNRDHRAVAALEKLLPYPEPEKSLSPKLLNQRKWFLKTDFGISGKPQSLLHAARTVFCSPAYSLRDCCYLFRPEASGRPFIDRLDQDNLSFIRFDARRLGGGGFTSPSSSFDCRPTLAGGNRGAR